MAHFYMSESVRWSGTSLISTCRLGIPVRILQAPPGKLRTNSGSNWNHQGIVVKGSTRNRNVEVEEERACGVFKWNWTERKWVDWIKKELEMIAIYLDFDWCRQTLDLWLENTKANNQQKTDVNVHAVHFIQKISKYRMQSKVGVE